MVSLWPWTKGDDSSPASFERALSTLSANISRHYAQLDALKGRARRVKAIWQLYSGFAYLLYTIIIAIVVGWENWGLVEYTAVAGGPVVIYLVHLLLSAYYNYRISIHTDRLDVLHKEREATIEKLKTATKYNSTQELLEKYGGGSAVPSPTSSSAQKRKAGRAQEQKDSPKPGGQRRTPGAPPPTANIPRNSDQALPSTPQGARGDSRYAVSPGNKPGPPPPPEAAPPSSPFSPDAPQFAPNAFVDPPQYSHASQSRWYDRVLDLLLGDDETLPKNRLVLICTHCRLVNGQAPPGTRHLEDVGWWRCAGCGGTNGKESETKRIIGEVQLEQAKVDEKAQGRRKLKREEAADESSEHEDADHDRDDEVVLLPSEDDDDEDQDPKKKAQSKGRSTGRAGPEEERNVRTRKPRARRAKGSQQQ
ncbi:MAG: hypothetical protein M1833_001199 [Piccolia ochrophora]|nr:MAG: hypothetical protein M1833_001199 [Piccolia ochrophora]